MRELGRLSPSLRPLAEAALEIMDAGEWPAAEARAAARMPLLERHLEQVMANHMFYEQFPQTEIAPRDAYHGLYAAYAMTRAAAVAALTVRTDDADVIFADAAAAAMRYIEHTDFYRNAAVVMRVKMG